MSLVIRSKRGVSLTKSGDGTFRVIADDRALVETKVESYAEIVFEEAVEDRDEARDRRLRERAHYDMQALRSESFARRAANARKTGGKGGRGGV